MVYRLTDASAIEARLLELAHTTDAKITAPALAYFAPCSIDDANRVLDDLAARDRLRLEIEDDGTVVYELPGRQKFAHPATPASPPRPAFGSALAPMVVVPRRRGPNPGVAAVLGGIVPGAGHLYTGRVLAALMWFLVVGAGYALLLPGLVLHLFSMVSAAASAARLNAPPRVLHLAPGGNHP